MSSQLVCKFFASPGGCRNGEGCIYQHVAGTTAPQESSTPCRFFNSPSGCRYGDGCLYAHVQSSMVTMLTRTNPSGLGGGSGSGNQGETPVCWHQSKPGGCRYGKQCFYRHTDPVEEPPQPQLPFTQAQGPSPVPVTYTQQGPTAFTQGGPTAAMFSQHRLAHPGFALDPGLPGLPGQTQLPPQPAFTLQDPNQQQQVYYVEPKQNLAFDHTAFEDGMQWS